MLVLKLMQANLWFIVLQLGLQTPVTVKQAVSPPVTRLHLAVSADVLEVKRNIDELEKEFQDNVIQLFALLGSVARKSPEFIDFIRAVLMAVPLTLNKHRHESFFEKYGDAIESASTVAKFQWIICSYCNFLNVSLFEHLLEHLMNKLGRGDLKAKFCLYMEHLESFRTSTKIGDFIDAQILREDRFKFPPEFVKIRIKLGCSWEECTLKDIENFHLDLCKKALLAPYVSYFISGEWSCIVLTWGIAGAAVLAVLQVLDEASMVTYAVDCDATATRCILSLPIPSEKKKLENISTSIEHQDSTISKCDQESQDKDNDTFLHWAASYGHLAVMEFFINQLHYNPMCIGQLDRTPLHHACEKGHLDIAKYLVEEGKADPSCQDENSVTPLHLATKNGHLQVVKYLTQEKQCDPENRDKYKNTSLHWAALYGQLSVMEFFITHLHCNPMCRGQLDTTPLHNASQEGHLDVAKYLVEEGKADPSCQDENGVTPLCLATKNGHLQVVKYLDTREAV